MRLKWIIIALVFTIYPVISLYSQESPPEDNRSLFDKTIVLDISTAGYYELLAWCRQLGLSDTGDRKKLQSNLYSHYGVNPPKESKAAERKEIEIASADRARFYSLKEIDENYIQLDSRVLLVVRENNGETVHEISADKITVNLELSLLYADGNISYKKSKKGSSEPEIYEGDILSFNIKEGDGIFYNGIGETVKDVRDLEGKSTGEKLKYKFKGNKIIKQEDGNIILEDAIITSSSSLANPNWHIRASQVMVLAPEEWVIENAVIYIGEIPFMYLPLYYNPGDKLFFNPVLGYRNDVGAYVQTTTYILGEKQASDQKNSFSFLDVTSDDKTKQYDTEIKGLFLRKQEKVPAAGEAPAQKKASSINKGDYLKIMLDNYFRLGFFGGADLKVGNYSLKGGLAVSRTLIPVSEGSATKTYKIPDSSSPGGYISDWNDSSFFGLMLPFRFGLEGSFKLALWKLNFNGAFQLFSDPFFTEDFYNRSEDMNILDILDLEKKAEEQTNTVAAKRDLYWYLTHDRIPIPVKSIAPYINSLQVAKFGFHYNWGAKADTLSVDPYAQYKPSREFYFPTKMIFPDTGMDISGNVPIYPFPVPAKPETETAEEKKSFAPDPGKGFHAPIKLPEKKEPIKKDQPGPDAKKSVSETDKKAVRQSPLRKNVQGIPDINNASKSDLTYSVKPSSVSITHYYRQDKDLVDSESVDFLVKYREFLLNNPSADLRYSLNLLGPMLTLSTGLKSVGNYKRYFSFNNALLQQLLERDPNAETEAALRNSALKADKLSLEMDLSLKSLPLLSIYDLQKSYFNYSLKWKLFEYSYIDDNNDQVNDKTMDDWDKEFEKDNVAEHKVELGLLLNEKILPLSLTVKSDLYPRDETISGTLGLSLENFSTSFTFAYADKPVPVAAGETAPLNEDGTPQTSWQPEPLSNTTTITLLEWVYLKEILSYNLDENRVESSTTELKLFQIKNAYLLSGTLQFTFPTDSPDDWLPGFTDLKTNLNYDGLNISLTMKRFIPKEYNPLTYLWEDRGDPFFSFYDIAASYNYNLVPVNFWKERIKLSGSINPVWNFNFNKFDTNLFKITFSLGLIVREFTTLTFNVTSKNDKTYLYFENLVAKTGGVAVQKNFFEDLFQSFNFFNIDDRRDSNFNLERINLELKHVMEDWDMIFRFSGNYGKLNEDDVTFSFLPEISIMVNWKAMPDIKREIQYNKQEFKFPKND